MVKRNIKRIGSWSGDVKGAAWIKIKNNEGEVTGYRGDFRSEDAAQRIRNLFVKHGIMRYRTPEVIYPEHERALYRIELDVNKGDNVLLFERSVRSKSFLRVELREANELLAQKANRSEFSTFSSRVVDALDQKEDERREQQSRDNPSEGHTP